MRPVHALLAASLATNAIAVGVWMWSTDRRPSDVRPDAESVRSAPVAAPPGSLAAPVLAPAVPDVDFPKGAAVGAGASATPIERALRRAATETEQREYEEFLRVRAAQAPGAFGALVAAREHKAADEAKASYMAELDARHGGPIEFLRKRASESGAAIPEFVRGSEFDRWFVPRMSGAALPVALAGKSPDILKDGDVLRFAAGAHRFSTRRWSHEAFPEDLVFEGAGRDVTIVTFDEFDTPATPILGLTFRDMTVDCGNEYLFDERGAAGVVMRFERCRLVRFDMGAGGSVAISTGPLAIRMTDCIVEVGFGRNPPYGNLFRCHGPILGRLERTTLRGVHAGYGASGSLLILDDCTVEPQERTFGDWKADWIRPNVSTSFVETPTDHASLTARSVRRPLSEINPTWKDVK